MFDAIPTSGASLRFVLGYRRCAISKWNLARNREIPQTFLERRHGAELGAGIGISLQKPVEPL